VSKIQYNLCGRIRDDKSSDATSELEETIRETKPILISFLVSQFSGTKIFLVGENVRIEKNSLRVEMVQLKWHLNILLLKRKNLYK